MLAPLDVRICSSSGNLRRCAYCSECASDSINREETSGRHDLAIGRLLNLVLIHPAEKAT